MNVQAAINARYGSPDVVEVRQAPKQEPKAREVFVKVCATTVSRTDCGMRRPHPQAVDRDANEHRPNRFKEPGSCSPQTAFEFQTSTASRGLRNEEGIFGPRPNRTTRSGRALPTPSQAANCGRMEDTSTG